MRCTSTQGVYQCSLEANHTSRHRDVNNNVWLDQAVYDARAAARVAQPASQPNNTELRMKIAAIIAKECSIYTERPIEKEECVGAAVQILGLVEEIIKKG